MPFDGPSGYQVVCEEWAKAWTPRRPLPTAAWAAKYRWLSGKSAAEPGQWKNERIPFLAPIMNALDLSHPAPIVVFVGSAQIAKSECLLNKIGQVTHQDPGPMLIVFPNEKQGRKWKAVRYDMMVAETDVLRAIIPSGRRSDSGNTQTQVQFPGGVMFTGSAGVPSDLASISVRYLFIEELDRFPLTLEDEGDPVELAMARLAAFSKRCKAFFNSTPTTDETSRIWPMWQSSTMDRYHMPCPHCSHAQYLRWEMLKWLPNRPSTAVYICEQCAAAIEEHSKTDMLAAGEWRAEHPEREADVKGFHANGLMTPLGLGRTWANHAAAWDRIQGSQGRLQVFMNTRLGEVHKGERQKLSWETVYERREPYRLRTIPRGVLLLTSGTDVQHDRLETQILGHGRGEVITVIDYQIHYGDPTRGEVWAALDEYLARELQTVAGVKMRLSCSLVDSGFLPDHVLNFTRPRRARNIFASRGSSVANRQPIGKPSFPDVKGRSKPQLDQRGAQRYELGASLLKHWLYEQLRSDGGTHDKPVTIGDRHIHFSDELLVEYFKGLVADVYDPKKGWIDRANWHHNEALDTFGMARAAAMHHSVNVHKLREMDWQRYESLYEPAVIAEDGKPAPKAEPKKLFGDVLWNMPAMVRNVQP